MDGIGICQVQRKEKVQNSKEISRIDLIIRWGNMRRLSGMLPIQSVYADFYVVERLWPDYQDKDFDDAIVWYDQQDVTLGGQKIKADHVKRGLFFYLSKCIIG